MKDLSVSDWTSILGCLFSGVGTIIAIIAFFRDKK